MNLRTSSVAALALVFLPGCEPDVSQPPILAGVVITDGLASIPLDHTTRLLASGIDSDGEVVAASVTWRSLAPDVVTVDSVTGLITGRYPGVALIEARSGAFADSVAVEVNTSECFIAESIRFSGHPFRNAQVASGRFSSGTTHGPVGFWGPEGVTFFWGSGIVYGTSPAATQIAYDFETFSTDFRSRVCPRSAPWHHTLSLLSPDLRTVPGRVAPLAIPGLTVVQEQYAFGEEDHNDYVLLKLTFTNTGPERLTGLRWGITADFDIYDSPGDVSRYDHAGQVVYVSDVDSVAKPLTAGLLISGAEVTSVRVGPERPQRGDYYSLLEPGRIDAAFSNPDVRHVIGIAPLTLEPGEKRQLWYAVVVGMNRSAFWDHAERARARIAALQ